MPGKAGCSFNSMEVMCVSESESSKVCAELNSRGDPPPLGAAQGIYMSSTAQTSFSGTWMPTGTQLVSQNQSEEEEEADFGEYQEEKENVNSGYRVCLELRVQCLQLCIQLKCTNSN